MTTLTRIGLCELAVGGLLGWVVTITRERRAWLARMRIVSPRRVLQCHIDYLMMGLILIVIDLVLPGLATIWQVLLVLGTIVNPALFAVLAFGEGTSERPAFRAVTLVSFTAMSTALVAAAVTGLTA